MIAFPASVRVWLAVGRTDMRRGMTGLALQVQEALGRDPHGGDLYVFRGARGDLIKILWHDGVGMSLYAKRLEKGRFLWPSPADGAVGTYRRRSCLICSMGSTGGIRATLGGPPAPDKIGRLHFPGVSGPDL
jgi:transposase